MSNYGSWTLTGIIEIKCPFTARNSAINVDSVPDLVENKHGILCLDSKHEYYYQVQGTMLCTSHSWSDFVVWTHCNMKVVRVVRNEEFVNEMVLKLEHFFANISDLHC